MDAQSLKKLLEGAAVRYEDEQKRLAARQADGRVERRARRQLDAVDWRNKSFTWHGVVEFNHTPESLSWAARQIALRLSALVEQEIRGFSSEAASEVLSGWTWVETVRYQQGGVCNVTGKEAKSFSVLVRPLSAYLEGRRDKVQIIQVTHEVRRWVFGLTERFVSAEMPAIGSKEIMEWLRDPHDLELYWNVQAQEWEYRGHHFPLRPGVREELLCKAKERDQRRKTGAGLCLTR